MDVTIDKTAGQAQQKTSGRARPFMVLATLAGVLTLSACTSVGYRCPLDPSKRPDSPTACAGMHEAMAGARSNAGGRTSVFVDDQGRIVPPELMSGATATPLAGSLTAGGAGRYNPPSGQPVFNNPTVFQAWSSSFIDANGNLHDGRTSWFTTPGHWNEGTVNAPSPVGQNIMRPVNPNDVPAGPIVAVDRHGRPIDTAQQPAGFTPNQQVSPGMAADQGTAHALQALGQAAGAARQPQGQAAQGVTAPQVQWGQ